MGIHEMLDPKNYQGNGHKNPSGWDDSVHVAEPFFPESPCRPLVYLAASANWPVIWRKKLVP